MTWLLPILRHRITWGVGIALGVWVAVAAAYRVGAWQGYRNGVAARAADAHRDAAAAQAVADSVQRVQRVALDSATARAHRADVAAALGAQRGKAAQHRVRAALVAVVVDSSTPEPVKALVQETGAAVVAWDVERAGFTAQLAAQATLIANMQRTIADEHTRTRAAVQTALVAQRATFRAPSRVTWATVGAVAGAVLTFGVLR